MKQITVLAPFVTLLLIMGMFLHSCDTTPTPISCEGSMFGLPIDVTGLDTSVCKPSCACKNFTSRNFSASELASLADWQLSNPPTELSSDPYESTIPNADSLVCAMIVEDLTNKIYRLETFDDIAAVESAGAILTHHDACGKCSSLKDFKVYAEDRDVGTAVKSCLLNNFASPFESLVSCLEDIGFTRPCAQIWAYNGRHTQANCLSLCLDSTALIYHVADGSLNDCLQCDEDISGPVFKAVAGRTRRNTGLASSICRPCEEVEPVEHAYPF